LGNTDIGLQVKGKTVKYRNGFWRGAARTSGLLKVRNEVTREKVRVIKTVLERTENSMLKCYGYVVRMEDNRWRKRIMTCSPEGRRQRGRAEVQLEKEAERVMKQRTISSKEAIN